MEARSRRCLLIGMVVVLAQGVASSAFAVKPAVLTYQLTESDDHWASCGDFDVHLDLFGTFRQTRFFDQDGSVVRMQRHIMVTATLTNSVTGAFVSDSPDPLNVVVDLAHDSISVHGLFVRITVPGVGIVWVQAGALMLDADGTLAIHGRYVDEPQALEALCAALE